MVDQFETLTANVPSVLCTTELDQLKTLNLNISTNLDSCFSPQIKLKGSKLEVGMCASAYADPASVG
jgi:hypothetical protein